MTSNRVRKLSPNELALVCGGSGMGTVTVIGDGPDPYWPSDEYDPWDQPNYDEGGSGGGDGGGEAAPTLEEMRDYLEGNPEFNELSDKLKSLVLQNEKLTTALSDMLKQGFKFERTDLTSHTIGNTIHVNVNAFAGNDPSNSVLNMFFHEVGHFVYGIPQYNALSDPNAYAQARAQAEVNADMFTVEVSKEVGITYYTLGTLTQEAANDVANGTFDSSDYQRAVSGNLNENPGLATAPPPDLNSDGSVTNTDLYLNQWRSSTGQTYSEWRQSQSSDGPYGGTGEDIGDGPYYNNIP